MLARVRPRRGCREHKACVPRELVGAMPVQRFTWVAMVPPVGSTLFYNLVRFRAIGPEPYGETRPYPQLIGA